MFTGIIECFGEITRIQKSALGVRLTIYADFPLDEVKTGDSIAVNGACLTVVVIDGKRFEVDVSPETLEKTTLGAAKTGHRVNLERALRFSDRLNGHLVSGHIDGQAVVKNRQTTSNAIIFTFKVSESFSRYMIKKGSVAVDGISLTINDCGKDFFSVSIIPYSAQHTTIGSKKIGEPVNIETDMIGKFVERFITKKDEGERETKAKQSSIDMAYLAKTGFL